MNERIKKSEQRRLYGLRGLADFLGISIPTAQSLQKSGKFPTYKPGKKKFVFLADEVLAGIKIKEKAPVGAGAEEKYSL